MFETSTFGINEFVKRQTEYSSYSYFKGSFEEVIEIAKANLSDVKIAQGVVENPKVIVVKVPVNGFYSAIVKVDDNNQGNLEAVFEARRDGEERYVKAVAYGVEKQPANFVELIFYSHENLVVNKENSTDCDFELVSINANFVEDEPMHPLTMARNFLEKTGGTKAEYTAEQFAKAIWYWKDKVTVG